MRVIVFAPHRDDEVLGVGGTIAKYKAQGHEVYVCEVTDIKNNDQLLNSIRKEEQKAHDILGITRSYSLHLPVVDLRDVSTYEKNSAFQKIVSEVEPDIAYIPHEGDMHSDHYETARAAMVALRPLENRRLQQILAYETLSETEWNSPLVKNAFIPNVWNDVTDYFEVKTAAMKQYASQLRRAPHPRSIESIEALGRLCGSTVGCAYAERFMMIRMVVR